jgi:hypothetical protein
MLIWRGWGFLVPLITFLCSLAAELVTNGLGGEGYWKNHSYPLSIALLCAGGMIWWADAILATRYHERRLVDDKTGERVILVPRHDFFFVRVKWWGLVCAGFAVAVLLMNAVPGSI